MFKKLRGLFSNDLSIDLGTEGRRAVTLLFDRARAAGIIPAVTDELFLPRP